MSVKGSSESKLSAEAVEFVPAQGQMSLDTNTQNDIPEAVITTDGAMTNLLSHPEAFFEIVNPLIENLSKSITDFSVLEAVVIHIFQQSIFEENYQYFGARLCSILSQKLKVNFTEGNFRGCLFKQCQARYKIREELSKTEDGLQELTGFTLFFAELMLNLKIEGLIDKFAPNLFNLLSLLLSIPNDKTTKCLNRVVKLTGSSLDASCPEKMNEIFQRIKDVIVQSDMTKEVRSYLLPLVVLRTKKWEWDVGATSQNDATTSDSDLPDPVFHDENGELVYEDFAGETENYDYGGYEIYDEGFEADYDAWISEQVNSENYSEDEMDPEMDEAYEQFLAQLKPPSSEAEK